MFKDEYLLDFINVEEIGVREKIDVDERVVEQSAQTTRESIYWNRSLPISKLLLC